MSTIYAFFDMDGTLISTRSMFSFQRFWYLTGPESDSAEKLRFYDEMHRLEQGGASREFINSRYYNYFGGRSVAEVDRCGRAWFEEVAKDPTFYLKGPLARLRAHHASGHVPVIVSGSFPAILAPIADQLGIRIVLSSNMVIEGGRYTGQLTPPQTIGRGKASAVRSFLKSVEGSAEAAFGYGDDVSDVPMLAEVGHPVAVDGEPGLRDHALRAGWQILRDGSAHLSRVS
jgi:HAD superfamily hydrolase (TIGR01490 family)